MLSRDANDPKSPTATLLARQKVLEQRLARLRAEKDTLAQTLLTVQQEAVRQREAMSWLLAMPLRRFERRFPQIAQRAVPLLHKLNALRNKRLSATALAFRSGRLRAWEAARAVARSGLFDAVYYARRYPEVARSGLPPLEHYMRLGAKAHRSPSALFDGAYYEQQVLACATVPPLGSNGPAPRNPVLHYLAYGAEAALSPHPLFDPVWYARKYRAARFSSSPLQHYLRHARTHDPSPFFDTAYYCQQCPEAHFADTPLAHFIDVGEPAGKDPCGLFCTRWYRRQYLRDAALPDNALTHFVRQGDALGCKPNPLFDPAWYRKAYPDIAAAGINTLHSYIAWGVAEGRKPNALFDTSWYLDRYPDVAARRLNPLAHYLAQGGRQGYWPNPAFDGAWYAQRYPEVTRAGINPLVDFLQSDVSVGRRPNAHFDTAWYRARYALPDDGTHPLAHFLQQPAWVHRATSAEQEAERRSKRAQVLGVGRGLAEVRVAVGVVTYNNPLAQLSRALRSTYVSLAQAGADASVSIVDNGDSSASLPEELGHTVRLPSHGNLGFGASHNRLMEHAFAAGATHYIAANPDGIFSPNCIKALLQMDAAAEGRALIEASQFPDEHPKVYDLVSFDTAWASGACLLVPKVIYEQTGGFDDMFFMYCEDVDLSWRARAAGFAVKTCPRALFYHSVTERAYDADVHRRFLHAGLMLATKWKHAAFIEWLHEEHDKHGFTVPRLIGVEPFSGDTTVADFTHMFSFSPVRW